MAGHFITRYLEGFGGVAVINVEEIYDNNNLGFKGNNQRFFKQTLASKQQDILAMKGGTTLQINDFWTKSSTTNGAIDQAINNFIINSEGTLNINKINNGYEVTLKTDHIILDHYDWEKDNGFDSSFNIQLPDKEINITTHDSTMHSAANIGAKPFHVAGHLKEEITLFMYENQIEDFINGYTYTPYLQNENRYSVNNFSETRPLYEKAIKDNAGHERSVPPLQ